jgi:hypothetical protein
MSDNTLSVNPTLPIVVNKDILSAYGKVLPEDVIYTNFETSRTLTSTTADTLLTSVCSLTASLTAGGSAYYNVVRMALYNRGFEHTFTGLTSDIGIYTFKKRYIDTGIVPGSFTATVTGTNAGDYYDNASGAVIYLTTSDVVGNLLYDEGLWGVTAETYPDIVNSVTAVRYKALVEHTELSVFCRAQPNEMNFSLNPTAFNSTANGNWMSTPFTGSTSAAEYFPDLVSSGENWTPSITHVGLYNDDSELLVLAKLTKPLRKPSDVPLTVRVQLDI